MSTVTYDVPNLYYVLEKYSNVYEGLQFLKTLEPEYLEKPKKPKFYETFNSFQIQEYTKHVASYEEELSIWEKETKERNEIRKEIYLLMEDYIKELAGLSSIPQQYRDKVWDYAYEEGHSAGYYEVYGKLVSLIDIFS